MQTDEYVSWQEDDAWHGYFTEYPDYWTQGQNLDDLREHLHELLEHLRELYASQTTPTSRAA